MRPQLDDRGNKIYMGEVYRHHPVTVSSAERRLGLSLCPAV